MRTSELEPSDSYEGLGFRGSGFGSRVAGLFWEVQPRDPYFRTLSRDQTLRR